MLDLNFVLKNKDLVQKNLEIRNVKVDLDQLEQLADRRVNLLKSVEDIRKHLNQMADDIKHLEAQEQKKALIEKGQSLKQTLREQEKALAEVEKLLREELLRIPNLTHPNSPRGNTDEDNVEVKRVGEPQYFSFTPKNHLDLALALDIVDFEGGARTTGSKFYFLKNEGVALQLALIQYALETLSSEGFQLYSTPDLASLDIIEGIGFLPRGQESQIYRVEEENLGLIATAEITLGGLYAGQLINGKDLPLKLGGISHCFRREAGAYGKASKGLYRVHQFTKVEMFVFCLPEDSDKMLDYLVDLEVRIFSGLGLPLRVVDCCSGELGGPAYRKFDLEVWLPGEGRWGEVTSASNCTDYQARRLNIKFKDGPASKPQFVHTLNGTALADARTIVAILENFQQSDGSILVPKALQKWLGKERLNPKIS